MGLSFLRLPDDSPESAADRRLAAPGFLGWLWTSPTLTAWILGVCRPLTAPLDEEACLRVVTPARLSGYRPPRARRPDRSWARARLQTRSAFRHRRPSVRPRPSALKQTIIVGAERKMVAHMVVALTRCAAGVAVLRGRAGKSALGACGAMLGVRVPSRTPLHAGAGRGARNLYSPPVGAPNGRPVNTCNPPRRTPRTRPAGQETSGPSTSVCAIAPAPRLGSKEEAAIAPITLRR